jgi:hypothetical protein
MNLPDPTRKVRCLSVRHGWLILGVLILSLIHPRQSLGQLHSSSEEWTGIWILNTGRSTFGPILLPGTPPDLVVIGQQLRIETADSKVRLSGDTSVKTSGQILSQRDDISLSLEGTEKRVGPAVFVLHPIDASTFEIISSVKQAEREYREVSRFVFSEDRTVLTETKTQTERTIASNTTPKSRDEVLKSSTSTLVFSEKP